MSQTAPIRIGISSCLLGQQVRFDGGHKRDRFLTDTLGAFVEWVPVCPEVEAGFGTPRDPMRLVADGRRVRLIAIATGVDLTKPMEDYAGRRVEQLAGEGLSGYVLKKDSPSCGVGGVKLYNARAVPTRSGRGLFAAALRARLPFLPIEDEDRLSDPALRDNFIGRVFAYRRLADLFDGRWTVAALVRFHAAHQLTLMLHSIPAFRSLGHLVARAKTSPRSAVRGKYTAGFMTALETIATRRRHTRVLQHMAACFKTTDTASSAEIRATIEDYRRGLVPLVVPLTLIRHHARRQGVSYLIGQTYLEPHPKELMLRNHV